MYNRVLTDKEVEVFVNKYMNAAVKSYCDAAASKHENKTSIAHQVIANKIANNDVIDNVIHLSDDKSRVCVLQGSLISGNPETILKATFTDFECICEDYAGNETSYSDEWFDKVYKALKSDRLMSSEFMSQYHKYVAQGYSK